MIPKAKKAIKSLKPMNIAKFIICLSSSIIAVSSHNISEHLYIISEHSQGIFASSKSKKKKIKKKKVFFGVQSNLDTKFAIIDSRKGNERNPKTKNKNY